MRKNHIIFAFICVTIFVFSGGVSVVSAATPMNTTPLPNYSNIYVQVANTEGVSFDENGNDTYYIQQLGSPNGGFNAVHIANNTSTTLNYGGATATTNQSGTFYATDTGGRGYQDDVVLMLAVNGTIPDNFSVNIDVDGYEWIPTGVVNACPLVSAVCYGNTLNETFTKSDFIYGPENWKPTGGNANYPIYIGENMSDPSNAFSIMFIDTHAGLLGSNYQYGNNSQFVNNGAVQINYTFSNLQSLAAFNIYAWNDNTTQGQGMLWTNSIVSGQTGGPSDYVVMGTAPVSAPVANFTTNTTSGIAPFYVQFNDKSSNNPISWLWNFGDGGNSTEQNPTYTYNTPGTYTVTETVTGPGGTNSTTTTINVNYPTPTANFTTNTTTGTAPLQVQFNDNSTGNITSYNWNFGDGNTSTLQNPEHNYTLPGTYTVTETVTGPGGTNNTTTTINVNWPTPTANFTTNTTTGTAPLQIQFNDNSNGNITSYNWNFGTDRNTSTLQNPTNTYNTPGTYTVTETVTGPGGTNSTTTTINVNYPTPTANFTTNTTTEQHHYKYNSTTTPTAT